MNHFLSHHELSTLILLLHVPTQVQLGSADLAALQQEGLVEVVGPRNVGHARLTPDGAAVLRTLGVS